MRPGGAAALVLVKDAHALGQVQRPLQPVRPVQRRRPPQPVDGEDLLRDRDETLCRHLLTDDRHWEEGSQIIRTDRLVGTRMEDGGRWLRQVGRQVVPGRRNGLLRQESEFAPASPHSFKFSLRPAPVPAIHCARRDGL